MKGEGFSGEEGEDCGFGEISLDDCKQAVCRCCWGGILDVKDVHLIKWYLFSGFDY